MRADQYERKYDEKPPEPVDNAITMGTTPKPDFESSPDVAVDGSIDTADEKERNTGQEQRESGLLARLRNWLY
jgi:hypothetical protein